MIKKLFSSLFSNEKTTIIKFLPLLIFGTFLEVVTIGIIYPFVATIINTEDGTKILSNLLGIENINNKEIIYYISIILVSMMIFSLLVRNYVTKKMFVIIYKLGSSISNKIYENHLKQQYNYYIDVSSPTIQVKINNTLQLTQKVISPLIQSFSYGFQAICITSVIIILNPLVALTSIAVLAVVYYFITINVKPMLRRESKISNESSHKKQQIIHESINGIKNIIIEKRHEKYFNEYKTNEELGYSSRAEVDALAVTPRYIVECAVIITLVLVANVYIYFGASQTVMLASFAVLGIAAQRVMPSIQIIYNAWASIEGNHFLVKEVFDDLFLPIEKYQIDNDISFPIESSEPLIELKNVSFSRDEKIIINRLNFKISTGTFVAIIGQTGSGKSTLIDLILGLIHNYSGELLINGIKLDSTNSNLWHQYIAYIPQQIYFKDASIAEIVSNDSIDNIDIDKLFKSLSIAEYHLNKEQVLIMIGDNGSRLSGGQRQRLAIARSIYFDKPILIFDEATSALDEETENKILKNIRNNLKNITLILITHRPAIVNYADLVINIGRSEYSSS